MKSRNLKQTPRAALKNAGDDVRRLNLFYRTEACREASQKVAPWTLNTCAFWRLFLRPIGFLALETRSKQAKPMLLLQLDAKRMQLLCFKRLTTQLPALIIPACFEAFRPVSTKK